jgi:hypothetical protein
MKIHHFASAAAAVITVAMAAPAFAQVGYVGSTVSEMTTDFGAGQFIDLHGGWSTAVSEGFNVQADGAYMNFEGDGDAIQGSLTGLLKTDTGPNFGATVSMLDLGDFGAPVDLRFLEGSVFTQATGERFVGVARAGYGNVKVESLGTCPPPAAAGTLCVDEDDAHYYNLNLDGNFFLTDNFSLNLAGDFVDYESLKPVLTGRLGFEWKLGVSPLSIGAHYSFNKDARTVGLTLRGTFGAETLLERAQNGPVSSPEIWERFTALVADIESTDGDDEVD